MGQEACGSFLAQDKSLLSDLYDPYLPCEMSRKLFRSRTLELPDLKPRSHLNATFNPFLPQSCKLTGIQSNRIGMFLFEQQKSLTDSVKIYWVK